MGEHIFSNDNLEKYLKNLNLKTILSEYQDIEKMAISEDLSYSQYLWELIYKEYEQKHSNRIARFLKESQLPLEKNLDSFDQNRLSNKTKQKVNKILTGDFLKNKENILAFGNPGTGKTHLLAAIGQELILRGHRVLFTKSALFIQDLLIAKSELNLANFIKKLSKFEAVLIDDIGYIEQSKKEMEVLFTFLAERYERGSVMISSNLAFSSWEKIFKDPMTTAAAIDRLIHHSVILELNLKSYRIEIAKNKEKNKEKK